MTDSKDQSTSKPADPSDELVAYLDGELDAEASRQVEQRLARDPAARQELQVLENTWGLLNQLPRSEVADSFTHTTVEMIALKATGDAQQEQGRRSRNSRRNWSIATCGAAAVLAAVLVNVLVPNPNDELLSDLPVIEHLDPYIEIGDIEFLRMLKRERLFDGEGPNEN